MTLFFGAPTKTPLGNREEARRDQRLDAAREAYLGGKVKIVTTESLEGREILGTFGLIVCRGYNFDNAFHGLVSQALEVNADAVLGYREHVAFHPEGDKYFSCYGTAVRLKPKK